MTAHARNAMTAAVRTRLEKAAADNGFDLGPTPEEHWLGFASSHAPLRVWLTAPTEGLFLAAVSQANVLRGLTSHGTAFQSPLPPGSCGARGVADFASLHRLLRRAFLLSRTLPDELLRTFERQAAAMPRVTEAERLVIQRVGQDLFRQGLLDYWEGRCAVTGLTTKDLLRASHIKPWADCPTDAERLDVYNGLLLAPHLDCAFDQGFVTVNDDGGVVVSPHLPAAERAILGLDVPLRVRNLADGHRAYLPWHRASVFRSG